MARLSLINLVQEARGLDTSELTLQARREGGRRGRREGGKKEGREGTYLYRQLRGV